jgi:hypothetical protein
MDNRFCTVLACILAWLLLGSGTGSVRAAQGTFPLFTTQEDFTPFFSGVTDPPASLPEFTNLVPVATPDFDGSSINGLGNPAGHAGGIGTPGALTATWNAGTYNFMFSAGEQGNAAFLNAIGTQGTFKFDFTQPPAGTGNYFQLGMVLNYDGAFDQFFGSTHDNGNGSFTNTINYTLSKPQATYSYFQLGFIYNSNFNTNIPFYIDNIRLHVNPIRGDANQDDLVNAADIQAYLSALTDLTAYQTAHPALADNNDLLGVLDINQDGVINNADIQSLLDQVAALPGGGAGQITAVPEPASSLLCVLGIAAWLAAERYRRSIITA